MKEKINWFWDCAAPLFCFLILLPLCLIGIDLLKGRVVNWDKTLEYLVYGALLAIGRLIILAALAVKIHYKKKKEEGK